MQNVYFREARGGLSESLSTETKFDSFPSCLSVLRFKYGRFYLRWYCYDMRFSGDSIIGTTYIVNKRPRGVIGYIYFKDGDAK